MPVKTAILVAYNNSLSSRAAVEYLCELPLNPESVEITLVHVFRKPSAGEDLMGQKFMAEQPLRIRKALVDAKTILVSKGFQAEKIDISLVEKTYATITEGIIDQLTRKHYDLVVIGRKRMSKAEEFVLGDPGTKLVRAIESAAVLIVKSH